jgi:DNA-binding NtrC family response regulator
MNQGSSAAAALTEKSTDKTVAIVDDDEDVREAYAIVLKKYGYQVALSSRDAETLIEGIRTKRPSSISECDTFLMDYHLGESRRKNGLDAAREIRKILPSARIAIASGDRSIGGGVIAEGFQFLPKPFSMSKLLELLR